MTLPALKTFGISDDDWFWFQVGFQAALVREYENKVFTGDAKCPMHFYGVGECICINNPVRT